MKRMIALFAALCLLAGCGAMPQGESAATTEITTPDEPTASQISPTQVSAGGIVWAETGTVLYGTFPLFVELAEDDIQLYGVSGSPDPGGMVLIHEGRAAYFDGWGYEKYGYPKMAYYDFDGDSKKEIAVITLVGSGTGVLMTELHIVTTEEQKESGADSPHSVDRALRFDDVAAYVNKHMTYTKDGSAIALRLGNAAYTAELDPDFLWREILSIGDVAEFSFHGKGIQLKFPIKSLPATDASIGDDLATCTADITFDGEQFHWNNFAFGEGYTD